MSIIKLNQKLKRLEITSFETSNEIVFSYFDKLPVNERDDAFTRALYIGVLALMEDRLSSFLAKTENELGVRLESLKMIFDMKQELFYKSAIKGKIAEDEIIEYLNNYFKERNLKDNAVSSATKTGKIPRNKTGDIICFVDGNEEKRIVIECKFDKSIRLGDMKNRDINTNKIDTAWSQLLEAQVNRDAKISIIVFDTALVDNSISKNIDSVSYIHDIGFIAIIDSQRGDYTNLVIAYNLARDIAINTINIEFDTKLLTYIIQRLINDIKSYVNVKNLVERNIEINIEILTQLKKSFLTMEFTQLYLQKLLTDGNLTSEDILAFYNADEIRDKFKLVEKEINELISPAT